MRSVAAAGGGLCSTARVLLWVLAPWRLGARRPGRHGTAAPGLAAGVRLRAFALAVVVAAALFAGYLALGRELGMLEPQHWDELLSGLGGGLQALGTVRLPYVERRPVAADRARAARRELLILAGLLTFWPRVAIAGRARACR